MDRYELELTRDCLTEAEKDLRHAEQHLIKSGGEEYRVEGITKIISAVQNRNKELGFILMYGPIDDDKE